MSRERSRPGDGARGAAMVERLAGLDLDPSALQGEREHGRAALVIEGGLVRTAEPAERARAVRRGWIGGAA